VLEGGADVAPTIDETFRFDEDFNPNRWLDAKRRELGIRGAHWLTTSPSKDPFKLGTAGDFEKAYWFRVMFQQFGYQGIHLRRLHYRIANTKTGTPLLWDGETPYLNIELHWNKLGEASKVARILGVVDPADFTEMYNKAKPTIWQRGSTLPVFMDEDDEDEEEQGPAFWFADPDYDSALPFSLGAGDGPQILRGRSWSAVSDIERGVTGFDYLHDMQPMMVEIWSETEFESFHRLANRYKINYIPLQGFSSLTAIKTMLRRLKAIGKPGRILYVSDYDPAGLAMPISFSRHCQFAMWEVEELAGEIAPEIKVDNVALTKEQVEEFDLPRMPIKVTDLRRASWELQHGEGAVEVEGMDATVPGELEKILETRIEDLLDVDLEDAVTRTRVDAKNRVDKAIGEVVEAHREDFDEVHRHAGEVRQRYQQLYDQLWEQVRERFTKLEGRFERHLEVHKHDLARVEAEVLNELKDMDVELPEMPEADAQEDAEREWLFSTEREFMEQTNHLRRIKGMQVYGEEGN